MNVPKTNLPSQVKLLSPINGVLNQTTQLTLVWYKAAYAQNYQLQIALDVSFTNLISNVNSITDTLKNIASLANNTTYYWRVQAINQFGTGTWSNTNSFTTMNGIQNKPTLILPLNNSINQPVNLQLKWNKIPGAVSYQFQLTSSNSFSIIEIADSSLIDTVKQVTYLMNNVKYYWRVRVKNLGGTGMWSDVYSFTTVLLTTDKPTLIYPSNNQKKLPLQTSFRWKKTITADSYWLQVSKDNMFIQLVINDAQITDTTKLVTLKNKNTKFYWRVAAKNISSFGKWSDTWSFTTMLSAPYQLKAALVQPLQIELTWKDSVYSLTEYKIERKCSFDADYFLIDSINATSNLYVDKSVHDGVLYEYRIKGVCDSIDTDYSNEASIITTNIENELVPGVFGLMQNYPNPFNPETIINYQVPMTCSVQIKIFDLLGREVKTLVDEEKTIGAYKAIWNATDNTGNKLASGIYIYSIKTNKFFQSRKMILMR
jgi:hypothetical protein